MNKLHLLYKKESGKYPDFESIEVTRMKGRWFIDYPDSVIVDMFGYTGIILFPDPDYIKWLEDKIIELLNT